MIYVLRKQFRLEWAGIHGAAHWARVRINGLRLAKHCDAKVQVIEYFAFLHDACRENDGHDPEHGQRAASFAASIRHTHIKLSDGDFILLLAAISGHTHGKHHEDVTVNTCWDADRLDLARVGIEPDPLRLSSVQARDPFMIEQASHSARLWLRQYLRRSTC